MYLFGDVEVNSTHTNFNAIREALRQTMVNQDVFFQNQVMQLHRLYSVQKSLMADPNWIRPEIDDMRYESLSNRRRNSDIPLVGSSEISCRGQARNHWDNILKLQLPLPNSQQQPSVPRVVKSHNATNVIFIDLEEDEVTTHESSLGMQRNPYSFPEIIDLENDEDCMASAQKTCERSEKDFIRGVPFIVDRGSSQGIDLNKVLNDGDPASCYSDSCLDANPSVVESAYVSRRPTSGNHIDFPPSIISRNTYRRRSEDSLSNTYQQVIDSGSKYEVDTEKKLGLIDLNCAPSTSLDPLEDVGSYSSNSGIENDCLEPRQIHNGVDCEDYRDFSKKYCNQMYAKSPQANTKGSEDQAFVSSCSYETPNTRDAVCWRSNSSNSQKTPQSKVEMGDPNMSSPAKVADAHSGADVAGSASSDNNPRPHASRRLSYPVTDEKSTPDPIIEVAADMLIHLSVVASSEEFKNRAGTQEKERNHMLDYSSDSFEANTLRLVESSADDYFQTPNAYEVSDIEKKDSNIKLMRGRRMKDFQKDILPSLSSLSGQEIQEDINIFMGVMRSREYRRTRAKIGEGKTWCLSRRCKRSRR